jgi:hypothetical protein
MWFSRCNFYIFYESYFKSLVHKIWIWCNLTFFRFNDALWSDALAIFYHIPCYCRIHNNLTFLWSIRECFFLFCKHYFSRCNSKGSRGSSWCLSSNLKRHSYNFECNFLELIGHFDINIRVDMCHVWNCLYNSRSCYLCKIFFI